MAVGILLLLAALVANRNVAGAFWLATGTFAGIGLFFGVWQSLLLILDRFTPIDFDPVMRSVRIWSLFGLAVLLTCIAAAANIIDLYGIEAMRRGDVIAPLIQAYRDKHGVCPETAAQLGLADVRLRMALADDEFYVGQWGAGHCYLTYKGSLMTNCTRLVAQGAEWTCDDD